MNQPRSETVTLANGLRVHLLPLKEFHQMAVALNVNFGSQDQIFDFAGHHYQQPAGVAHFLEHRLFGQPGYDAFNRLTELGANANAFTTRSRTCYYFTSLANNLPALKELVTFTQTPYFDPQAVEREAAIIEQEAAMYADNPDAQLFRTLTQLVFPQSTLATEIVGNPGSIQKIGPADLLTAFQAFYQPDNCDLYIAGAFNSDQVKATIEASLAGQRPKETSSVEVKVSALSPSETAEQTMVLPVAKTRLAVGCQIIPKNGMFTGKKAFKMMLVLSLALDLALGEYNPLYMDWYNSGLINDDFFAEVEWERGYAFLTIATETPEPRVLFEVLKPVLTDLLGHVKKLATDFELVKRDALARTIARLNDPESIVTDFEGASFDGLTTLDEIALLRQLTADDLVTCLRALKNQGIAHVIAYPKA